MTPDPVSRFVSHLADAAASMAALQSHVADHLGTDPESLTWANVGDAAHLAEKLRELVAHFGSPVTSEQSPAAVMMPALRASRADWLAQLSPEERREAGA